MRSRALGLSALVMALLVVSAGCALLPVGGSPTPIPTGSETGGRPDDSVVTPDLQAVIVVAAVDVDGRNVTVSGYAAGTLENGGQCTYTFTGPSAQVEVSASGIADRSVTSCGATQVSIENFTKGTWEVIMRYTALSGDAVTSDDVTLEIP